MANGRSDPSRIPELRSGRRLSERKLRKQRRFLRSIRGYTKGAGDAHMYLPRPWRPEDLHFFRTTGSGMKHVFLSEYGNGSQIDPIRIVRLMEQNGGKPEFDDYKLYAAMYQQLERDWKRWRLDRVFASPSDMVRAGQLLQSTLRLSALDAIRSNPNLVGYSLTGLSDQAIEGE